MRCHQSDGRSLAMRGGAAPQVVNGKRAPNGFSGRALPHFPRGDRTPEGKGFVAASFYRCAAAVVVFELFRLRMNCRRMSEAASKSALLHRCAQYGAVACAMEEGGGSVAMRCRTW